MKTSRINMTNHILVLQQQTTCNTTSRFSYRNMRDHLLVKDHVLQHHKLSPMTSQNQLWNMKKMKHFKLDDLMQHKRKPCILHHHKLTTTTSKINNGTWKCNISIEAPFECYNI
jgi:hypothetical protein